MVNMVTVNGLQVETNDSGEYFIRVNGVKFRISPDPTAKGVRIVAPGFRLRYAEEFLPSCFISERETSPQS